MARVYQRDEVDGVPVFWTEAPAELPFTVALVFRVGFADETLRRTGSRISSSTSRSRPSASRASN